MSFIIELRDGTITIPKKMYELYLDFDWYLSGLVNFNSEENKISLWEDKNVVMSIFDSLKYKKLIVHENVSLEYLYILADMWCVPKWLIDEIKEKQRLQKNQQINEKLNIFHHTFSCIHCSSGFREINNTPNSCKHHRSVFNHSTNKWNCCGGTHDSEPCVIGFHVAKIYDFNLVYNLINKNQET